MDLMHARPDGTFVIRLPNGWPYHVVQDDPLFPEVAAAAEGVDLPPEPMPEPLAAPPEPTKAELLAQLAALAARIEALS